jgi:bifunctional ADP-heptose synthase (sugar kinase/adenylyltransferase)
MIMKELSIAVIRQILSALPHRTIGVLGDLFLDRYLDIDTTLTEPSIETGLDAFQVIRVRSYPGAAGTVINNLSALGVGRTIPIALIGDDGEGYELRQALQQLTGVETARVYSSRQRRTPTYTKPMLQTPGQAPCEFHRLDIKNRQPMAPNLETELLASLDRAWPSLDGLVVLDQVSEADCGVVTGRVRQRLAELAAQVPDRLILADSRAWIGLFRQVCLKPNQAECVHAVLGPSGNVQRAPECAVQLAQRCGRPVFCTGGERGIFLIDPAQTGASGHWVAGCPVSGAIDPVGAGDSTSAGIASAIAAGASLAEAAAFGNLVASITIQQLGTTGTASPSQVLERWTEISEEASSFGPSGKRSE